MRSDLGQEEGLGDNGRAFSDAFVGTHICQNLFMSSDVEMVIEKHVNSPGLYNTTWWILTSFTEARKLLCGKKNKTK